MYKYFKYILGLIGLFLSLEFSATAQMMGPPDLDCIEEDELTIALFMQFGPDIKIKRRNPKFYFKLYPPPPALKVLAKYVTIWYLPKVGLAFVVFFDSRYCVLAYFRFIYTDVNHVPIIEPYTWMERNGT